MLAEADVPKNSIHRPYINSHTLCCAIVLYVDSTILYIVLSAIQSLTHSCYSCTCAALHDDDVRAVH